MDKALLEAKFGQIGARLDIHKAATQPRWLRPPPISVNVKSTPKGERFDIALANDDLDLRVLDLQPADRHLLLLVARTAFNGPRAGPEAWQKLLCGHDERHWFVAGVPVRVSTVREAKEALKPSVVRESEVRCRVKPRHRNRRRNAGFIRQGEWFFVPAPDLCPDDWLVLHKEPIRRGLGKPHIVEHLYRRGGTTVHVCPEFPNGLIENEFATLLHRKPEKSRLPWRLMKRDPEAFAKGWVRHPDHKTVVLSGWHRIVPNNEVRTSGLAFLD